MKLDGVSGLVAAFPRNAAHAAAGGSFALDVSFWPSARIRLEANS